MYLCNLALLAIGHSKAVRDICFNNSGTQFLSAAYDRYLKLWDTETGRLLCSDDLIKENAHTHGYLIYYVFMPPWMHTEISLSEEWIM